MSLFKFLGGSYFFPANRLTLTEVKMLPEGMANLFLARIKVSFSPSGKWMPAYTMDPATKISPKMQKDAIALAKIINGLSTRTPWKSTCLVKVLAAHHMLMKRGIKHAIHFGVNKDLSNGIKAHAWLSVEAKVLIGGVGLDDFQEIPISHLTRQKQ